MSARPGYAEYMNSAAWAAKRQQRLELDGRKCRTCGATADERPLQVHHVSYARLGTEELGDLITLCTSCHEAITDVMRRRRYADRRIEVEFEEFVSSLVARIEVSTYGMASSEVRTEIIVRDARSQRQGGESARPIREDAKGSFEQEEQDRRRSRANGAD